MGTGSSVAVVVNDILVGVDVFVGVVVEKAAGLAVSVGIDVDVGKDRVVGVTAGVQEPSPRTIANSNCFFNLPPHTRQQLPNGLHSPGLLNFVQPTTKSAARFVGC